MLGVSLSKPYIVVVNNMSSHGVTNQIHYLKLLT